MTPILDLVYFNLRYLARKERIPKSLPNYAMGYFVESRKESL